MPDDLTPTPEVSTPLPEAPASEPVAQEVPDAPPTTDELVAMYEAMGLTHSEGAEVPASPTPSDVPLVPEAVASPTQTADPPPPLAPSEPVPAPQADPAEGSPAWYEARYAAMREELEALAALQAQQAHAQGQPGQPAAAAAPQPVPVQEFVTSDERFDEIRADRGSFNKFLTDYMVTIAQGIFQNLPGVVQNIARAENVHFDAWRDFKEEHRDVLKGNPAFVGAIVKRTVMQNPELMAAGKFQEVYGIAAAEIQRLKKLGIFPNATPASGGNGPAPVIGTQQVQQVQQTQPKPQPLEPRVGAMPPPQPPKVDPKHQEMFEMWTAMQGDRVQGPLR